MAMARKLRRHSNTGIYHVMLREINRQDLFHEESDYLFFQEKLRLLAHPQNKKNEPASPLYDINVYSLMTDHVHLLPAPKERNLSDAMECPLKGFHCYQSNTGIKFSFPSCKKGLGQATIQTFSSWLQQHKKTQKRIKFPVPLIRFYDANGNLAYESVARERHDDVTTTPRVSERKLLWDGMNRLSGISNDGYASLYWYDAGGSRTVKEHQGGEAVWVNGTAAGANTDSVSYSIYPNPYISICGDRWTKHYYIGSERIASRTGTVSGGFTGINDPDNPNVTPAGPGNNVSVNYAAMCRAEEDSASSAYSRLGVPYEVQRTIRGNNTGHLVIPIRGIDGREDGSADSAEAGKDRNHPNTLGDGQVYFFFRDHLGSTLSVTDSVGNYAQQVEYTPWGEVFVESG